LLIAGQIEQETEDIVNKAQSLLGSNFFKVITVPKNEIKYLYMLSDFFVLGSLEEGFGLVFIEAMSHGLPIFCHEDMPLFYDKELNSCHVYKGNFKVKNGFSSVLNNFIHTRQNKVDSGVIHKYAYDNYSWDVLLPEYIKLIKKVTEEK
jgi:glycosyltransferase involved in cell wall biosynthesis